MINWIKKFFERLVCNHEWSKWDHSKKRHHHLERKCKKCGKIELFDNFVVGWNSFGVRDMQKTMEANRHNIEYLERLFKDNK